VNGRRVDVASFQVSVGDEIGVAAHTAKNPFLVSSVESVKGRGVPEWVELDSENLKGRVVREPQRGDIAYPIEEQLIVELYSK
jgi:small subunit ribosomal protein S4